MLGLVNGPDPRRCYSNFEFRTLPIIHLSSNQIRRIPKFLQPNKVLLDTARAHESVEDRNAPCFVVGSTCASATEWLLTDNRARALIIVVHIASGIAQFVRCLN
jgi:hypothetical protein